ncbi:MAG: transposase [Chloroflexota bacterium]|nr:transposase [Chloroflexota bacterium]
MSESSPLTFIGMDVSRDKIAIAMLRPDEQVPIELTIAATDEAVRKAVRRWGDPAAVRSCYGAGPTGYELQRQLAALGVDCIVVAPSLIPQRPGRKVKTDRRDARNLCGLLHAGELTAVRVPDPDEEVTLRRPPSRGPREP